MIIGISGKSQSGKDTVGEIIRYLSWCKVNDIIQSDKSYQTFLNKQEYDKRVGSNFETHKFADALKDIICILIGCTREQLEDNDFKNSQLSSEWVHQNLKGISSRELARKDEYNNIKNVNYTYRELLQKLGTDLLRNQLHENTWINALFNKYKTYGKTKCYANSTPIDDNYPNWIITDVRFPNEADAIKSRSGINIRLDRPNLLNNQNNINLEHISETSLDYYKFNYYIYNDSSIENLIEQIKNILIKEKLL